jgi:hypothetical protein
MRDAFGVQSIQEIFLRADQTREAACAVTIHFKWINRSWNLHYAQTSDGRQFLTEYAQRERQREEEHLEKYLLQTGLTGGYTANIPIKDPRQNS